MLTEVRFSHQTATQFDFIVFQNISFKSIDYFQKSIAKYEYFGKNDTDIKNISTFVSKLNIMGLRLFFLKSQRKRKIKCKRTIY